MGYFYIVLFISTFTEIFEMKLFSKILVFLLFNHLYYSSFSEEPGLQSSETNNIKKEKKDKRISSIDGASYKGNFIIQPTLNFGHHTGFKKVKSSYGFDYTYSGFIPGVTLNLDYNVHDYVGVGVYYSVGFQKFKISNISYLGNAFGVRGVFHWWQLMDDKSDKELLSDKIDLDIHFHLGGFLLSEKNKTTDTKIRQSGFNAGGGIGLKYYFVKNFGVAIDAGYEETSWAKLGLVFKI